MTALNVTALQSADGMSQVICVVNSSANGLLTGGLLIAMFFIILLILKKWSFINGLLVSSWSCFLVSLIMSATTCPSGESWISVYYSLVFLLLTALSALYLWTSGES